MLSTHLSVSEYLATSHREFVAEQERAWVADSQLQRNAQRLAVEVFEPVRASLVCSLHVTSGFRCPALNEAVGGKPGSLHQIGLAIDVVPVGIDPRSALFALLHAMRRGELPRLDKVIVEYGRWLHLQATREGVPAQHAALESADGRTFSTVTT